MSKRAQLNHLLLDVDFFDKPTVRALGYKHTQIAVHLYMRWLLLMSRATNGAVTRDALFSIAREVLHGVATHIANQESVLDYCIKTGMVHITADGFYTNSRVVKDQESLAIKREESNARQARFREKKSAAGNALVTRLPDTVTDTESKKETVTTPAIPSEPLTMPAALDSPESRKALTLFCAKYREKFKSDFDQILLDAAMMPYGNRINDWIRDVSGSVGWKKIRDCSKPEPEKRWPEKQAQPERKSVVPNAAETGQRMREIVAQASKKPIDPETKAAIERLKSQKGDTRV